LRRELGCSRCYHRGMRRRLVLWDVDDTLVHSADIGRYLFQIAYHEMFGREMPEASLMAGRTDRAISLEVLTLAGVRDPARQVDAFITRLRERAPGLADLARTSVREKTGAEHAIAALAALPGSCQENGNQAGGVQRDRLVVQSLLTGNVREIAELKLGPFDLVRYLDLDAGAYGNEDEVRARLVPVARRNAARTYRHDFAGEDTVLVGDTPLDVAAALAEGARAVAVATGRYTVAELAAAGPHVVLSDLADTGQVVAAILGRAG
jgi:phosphoglycolate phosphatase